MSKNHQSNDVISGGKDLVVHGIQQEYMLIHRDLARVVILNVVYLAGIVSLYYSNLQTHYLENWFVQVFHS